MKQVDQNLRPNHIILLTVLNAQYPIDVDIISKVTQPIGRVLRIVVFKRGALVQSMVEFEDIETATAAKNELHRCDIYAGSCTLKVEFATTDRLNVKRNADMTWDFTDECVLPREEGENQRDPGGTISLLTTIEGKPILEIEIPQHGRDMRLRVLLQTKDGRMEIGGIGPWALCHSLGKELTKSDEITFEITHERDVEGKFTLALSVADQVLTRVNVDSQILRNLTDIKLNNYYIKNVIVLNKP